MKVTNHGFIDRTGSMYPTFSRITQNDKFLPLPYSTTYGVVLEGVVREGRHEWVEGEYFSLWAHNMGDRTFEVEGKAWFVARIGFKGQDMTGHRIEPTGRLTYIDNCSSTILVNPPRYGDPSLHLLHFPRNIDQSYHTHPSIRMGLVYSGRGTACLMDDELPLEPGTMFCLDEQEVHRFTTGDEEMRIIAYHPDGNWGPTDEAHPMLNRTFVIR